MMREREKKHKFKRYHLRIGRMAQPAVAGELQIFMLHNNQIAEKLDCRNGFPCLIFNFPSSQIPPTQTNKQTNIISKVCYLQIR